MTAAQVREILKGRFEDQEDRKYWEDKLVELEAKEARSIENTRYFDEMRVYDR